MGSVAQEKLKVAIVGGGIGGLCLAIGLVDNPYLDVTVYEATKHYGNVGQGLAMHGNAIRAMENIDPEIPKAWRDSSALVGSPEDANAISVTTVFLAWGPHKGTAVAELGQAKARKTVSRSDLLSEFLSVLQRRGGKVELGKRLNEVEDRGGHVSASFEDGSMVEVDCFIGADGVRSKTREYLLGPDHPALPPKNHEGYVSLRKQVPIGEAKGVMDEHWTRNVAIRIGPSGWLTTMPVRKGANLLIGTTFLAPKGIEPKDAQVDADSFDGYDDEFRRLLKLGLEGEHERLYFWDHDPAPTYVHNRVCMMGDAAHCTAPFAGNGAAQAIEDAAVLKALFMKLQDPSQIPSMLEAYDKIRRPRSQKVVEISRRFGRLNMLEGRADYDIENIKQVYSEGASYTNDVDIEAQNEDAVRSFEALVGQ